MVELGLEGPQYHEEIAAYARERADAVIGVGELAQRYRPDHWFANSKESATRLPTFVHRGDCLLVKGSHSVHLERVVEELRKLSTGLLS